MGSVTYNLDYQIGNDITGDYAEAAITTNPNVTWIKFVFTDDQPNGNKQRIPQSEFGNIIKTGVHMPIKMQALDPNGKHQFSTPIGTITNLVHPEDSGKVVGLAALWNSERENDVALLREKYSQGEPLNLSWEVFYTESEEDENGVHDLRGTTVRAITFVGDPAYKGRTNVLAMAEETKEETQLETKELEAKIEELQAEIQRLTGELEAKNGELEGLASERDELANWKSEREQAEAAANTLKARREALKEAGIEFSDEDFEARSERIAALDDDAFAFYMQDLVAFADQLREKKQADSSLQVPDVTAPGTRNNLEIVRAALNQTKETK